MELFVKIFLLIYLVGHPEAGVRCQADDNMIVSINTERENVGLPSLKRNQKLVTSATNKAFDMVLKKYVSHNSPDGTTPWKFFLDEDYKYEYAGENFCKNLKDDECFGGLMGSTTHRENILGVDYTDVGVGKCGDILVQHFGGQ